MSVGPKLISSQAEYDEMQAIHRGDSTNPKKLFSLSYARLSMILFKLKLSEKVVISEQEYSVIIMLSTVSRETLLTKINPIEGDLDRLIQKAKEIVTKLDERVVTTTEYTTLDLVQPLVFDDEKDKSIISEFTETIKGLFKNMWPIS